MATTLAKPSGLPVLPPHANPQGDCLLHRLLRDQPWRSEIAWPAGFAGGIAHRLDNGTSGAVLVADSLQELHTFRGWFQRHLWIKTYWFLTAPGSSGAGVPPAKVAQPSPAGEAGFPPPRAAVPLGSLAPLWLNRAGKPVERLCDLPIAHHPRKKDRMVVKTGPRTSHRGKWYPAKTTFRLIRGRLFEAVITTGVMHQIRVHAAYLGIPILGDAIYSPPGTTSGGVASTSPSGRGRFAHSVGESGEGCAPFTAGSFCLHHVGMTGPGGFRTDEVPRPPWAGG